MLDNKGPYNKHVTVEGEGGVHEIRDEPLQKFWREVGSGLARNVTENIKFLRLSTRNIKIFSKCSFKKASKYPIAIAAVSTYTYIAIIMTYILFAF